MGVGYFCEKIMLEAYATSFVFYQTYFSYLKE